VRRAIITSPFAIGDVEGGFEMTENKGSLILNDPVKVKCDNRAFVEAVIATFVSFGFENPIDTSANRSSSIISGKKSSSGNHFVVRESSQLISLSTDWSVICTANFVDAGTVEFELEALATFTEEKVEDGERRLLDEDRVLELSMKLAILKAIFNRIFG
jgi:hypothetical protein